MDNESSVEASSQPIKVEVTNVADFRDDLAAKLIAGVAVAIAVSVVKIGVEDLNAWRKRRKAAKAEEKKEMNQK